jgi:hypothetical protein
MIIKNKTDIFNSILSNSYKIGFYNIISPPLSGKSQFLDELKNKLSDRAKLLILNLNITDLLNFEIIKKFKNELSEEYGYDVILSENGISLSDSILFIIRQINEKDIKKIYFLIDDIEKHGISKSYDVLSQIRNIREKVTADLINIDLCFICLGSWKPSEMQNKCNERVGSSFPEEIFYSDLNFKELKDLVHQKSTRENGDEIPDYKIKYLLEISGGCYSIVDYIIKNTDHNYCCDEIRDKSYKYADEDYFVDNLIESLNSLSEDSKKMILNSLNNRIVKFKNNKETEELLLSGIMKISQLNGLNILVLRSWIHQVALRKNERVRELFGSDKIYCKITEIIPPTPSLNKKAYEIVLEIENRLRNFLVVYLNEYGDQNTHPFEKLNDLNKLNINWAKDTLFDEITYQKKRIKDLHSDYVDAYSSLSSFLSLNDIISILFSKNESKEINTYLNKLFIDNEENKSMFHKFRIIRNQVAHNNIVTESMINELNYINEKIINILFEKC